MDEYQRFRGLEGQLAELTRTQQAALDAKEAERLKALAEKGQIEEALAQQRKAWEAKHAEALALHSKLEAQVSGEKIEATASRMFATVTFAGDSAEQKQFASDAVRRELVEELETTRDAAGGLHVRHKGTGQDADSWLKEKLASPRYAGILAASKAGGSGADGSRPAIGDPAKPPEPGSVAERVSQFMAARSQAWGLSSSR